MSNVASQEKPTVPVKTVDKAASRTTKRNVEPQAPAAPAARGSGGNRRGGARGSEGAFRDRGVGSDRNHGRSTEEAPRNGPRGGYGARVRGGKPFRVIIASRPHVLRRDEATREELDANELIGRGSRRPREHDDRHPSRATGHGSGSDKQAAQSWGATEGDAELKDEQAGDVIAQTEKKDALVEDGAAEEPAEPEDKSVSYSDYVAQQAEKKAALEADFKVREANEGSKLDKKWANAKTLEKEEEDFIASAGGKAKRERERKIKQTIDFDPRFVEPERTRGGARGGRGGARGGRGGERGGDRGRGGNFRGAARGGASRGGRDNAAAPINTKDESAFPSLGGK
ncbi:hypothetical protein TOPH_07388 [Tolypocladium ophioglossoides CBS 100239]|uniref:Hyaluronan/mRNA-binding protein domain-containing protein n=1 Tax=Tolypocladium ophioglossoides (strain CBS 100239) TaxID=1163406 RepID=A0A0L0N1W6_TOLOC|nr:hypothetical protein TOPH_07388 [Tolypocladium ophioglossoides CBS 100239]